MIKAALRTKWTFSVVAFVIASSIIVSPFGPGNRSPQDVALVFGLPIILTDTVVSYGLSWLLSIIAPSSTRVQQPTLPFSSYGRRVRTVLWSLGVIIALAAIMIPFSIALYGASFLYPLLAVAWATAPAQHLATVFFVIGILPLTLIVVFVAGIQSARYLNKSLTSMFEELASQALRLFLSRIHSV